MSEIEAIYDVSRVAVMPYSHEWPQRSQAEATQIAQACGESPYGSSTTARRLCPGPGPRRRFHILLSVAALERAREWERRRD